MQTQNEQQLTCKIAMSAADRDEVYRLRYRCYHRGGSIEASEDLRFSDRFDATENHFSFLIRNGEPEALATVRISVVRPDLGWTDSPAASVFGDHPAYADVARESYVEASRLCFGEQARRDVLMRLLGNMAALAEFYNTRWLLACPRAEHAPMYRRLFGFQALAEPRQYFGVKFETQMLGVRTEDMRAWVSGAKPMVTAWSQALRQLKERPSLREVSRSRLHFAAMLPCSLAL